MPSSDWTPVLVDVGDILHARTKDTSGNELGTFSADTRPTDAQVNNMIAKSVADIAGILGADLPPPIWGDAKYVASLGAALLIELSYFPEQIGSGRSPYAQFKELYDERFARLKTAAERAGDSDVAGDSPHYSFPMVGDPFIIGRRTAW